MTRLEASGTIQLTLPEPSTVIVIPGRRTGSRAEPLLMDKAQPSPITTELVRSLGEAYRQVRNWDELFTGSFANFGSFSQHVLAMTGEEFDRLPGEIVAVTSEMPAEGRTIGSRQAYPAEFTRHLIELALEIRTLPPLRRAS